VSDDLLLRVIEEATRDGHELTFSMRITADGWWWVVKGHGIEHVGPVCTEITEALLGWADEVAGAGDEAGAWVAKRIERVEGAGRVEKMRARRALAALPVFSGPHPPCPVCGYAGRHRDTPGGGLACGHCHAAVCGPGAA